MVTLDEVRKVCPTRWVEMKTRHYQKIIKDWDQDKPVDERDYFKLCDFLTDGKFSFPEHTIENQVIIESLVAWVVLENFQFDTKAPQTVELFGKQVNIPKNLKAHSIGANIKARQMLDKSVVLVDKEGNFLNCNCYSTLVAIYLQPELKPYSNGGFNWALAEELEKEIAELPIYIIYPIGFFLLSRVYEFGQKRGNYFKQTLINLLRRSRKVLLGWLKFNDLSHSPTYH